jgi:4-hydroxy-tetrahydrodipicolinate reductase
MIGLAVAGAGGRMGRQVLAAALADPDVTIQAGLVRPGSAVAGQDLGALAGGALLGVAATAADAAHTALDGRQIHALIDFSRAAATVEFAGLAATRGIAFLTGTTGLTPEQTATVKAAANRVPVLIASNTSVGLTALLQLLPALVRALGPDYDLEIVETHHRHKADAPSGTALTIARLLAEARGDDLDARARFGREGHAPRQPGEIGLHAVRAGGSAGEHRIILANEGEQLEIIHRAFSRQTYAAGALRAARWLAAQPPGLYTMAEAIGV